MKSEIDKDLCILNIISTIHKIKNNINKFYNKLSRNEALTRYVLIDPFLRSIGWDLGNPKEVIPEFSTEVGVPDYALLQDDKLFMFIEAKALGKIKDVDQVKVVSYAVTKGVQYLTITDGDSWIVYDLYREGNIEQKQILTWSMSSDDAVTIAIKALFIANLKPPILSLYRRERQLSELVTKSTVIKLEHDKNVLRKKFKGPITSKTARDIILTILKSEKRPLSVKEIFERAQIMFEPTEEDKKVLSNGEVRWQNRIRWELSKLAKEGLIKRVKEGVYKA
ncbi:hypothetical protein APE_1558 [Aeropyrum pernix K1]|uniref:Restriction system protein Mrr-like N-terminal domain-containing protein n=1 Tax=Aeropyrum pernix (strain ATCC 700893 / DSM 11879 / JCM 9820 / NBRC 100138 / K1) TaxID=272557 RepID=Q9YBP1_AERPE|nr:winged helix-turn-helix domain-containing protein [Aeropyrum pernix]BAA80557.1 hypothetical protein APE_1558 [Aeropyrum pernix K1]